MFIGGLFLGWILGILTMFLVAFISMKLKARKSDNKKQ